jgi:hypothetical protein
MVSHAVKEIVINADNNNCFKVVQTIFKEY